MKQKWKPEGTKKLIIEIDEEKFNQRVVDLAEVFYDCFCELHLNRSVEPANNIDFEEIQDLEKAG